MGRHKGRRTANLAPALPLIRSSWGGGLSELFGGDVRREACPHCGRTCRLRAGLIRPLRPALIPSPLSSCPRLPRPMPLTRLRGEESRRVSQWRITSWSRLRRKGLGTDHGFGHQTFQCETQLNRRNCRNRRQIDKLNGVLLTAGLRQSPSCPTKRRPLSRLRSRGPLRNVRK